MTDEVKAKAPAKRKFEVAPGKSLTMGPSTKMKAKAGQIVELTAAEFKMYPKGSLLPYVEDDEPVVEKKEE